MDNKEKRMYGRVHFNKLDLLIGIAFGVICLGALIISLGVCLGNLEEPNLQGGWLTVLSGLGLYFPSLDNVGSALAGMIFAILFYGSLILMVVGIIVLNKLGLSDRIPGLIAIFVSCTGIGILYCFVYEYTVGVNAALVNQAFPFIAAINLVLLAAVIGYSIYLTFFFKTDIELKNKIA